MTRQAPRLAGLAMLVFLSFLAPPAVVGFGPAPTATTTLPPLTPSGKAHLLRADQLAAWQSFYDLAGMNASTCSGGPYHESLVRDDPCVIEAEKAVWGGAFSTVQNVSCGADGLLTELVLLGCSLKFRLDDLQALADLTALESLNFEIDPSNWASNPGISGTIPGWLGRLTRLRSFGVGGASLSGTLPAEMGLLTRLTNLDLQANHMANTDEAVGRISGTIPASWASLSHMEQISFLQQADLSGSLAPLSAWVRLHTLNINGCGVGGHIARELASLVALRVFNADNSKLSGTLPASLDGLSTLDRFTVLRTSISGTLPTFSSTFLEYVDFSLSRISGTLPQEWGRLQGLQRFRSYGPIGRGLSGVLPKEWGVSGNLLRRVDLSNNLRMSGTLPRTWLHLFRQGESPSYLKLVNVSMSGTIPPAWAATDISSLEAPNAQLSGSVPAALLDNSSNFASALNLIDLSNNRLSGTLERNFAHSDGLKIMKLGGNRLSGTLAGPPCFAWTRFTHVLLLLSSIEWLLCLP